MDNLNLTYRRATLEDFDDFYAIKADKENIAWGGFTEAPNRTNFFEWYKRQLDSDCRWIYLVFSDSKCCAFFYVDRLEDGTYEAASSGVLTEFMGEGIGTYALSMQIAEIQRFVPNGGGVRNVLGVREKRCFIQEVRETWIRPNKRIRIKELTTFGR